MSEPENTDLVQLVERARQGDREAFTGLEPPAPIPSKQIQDFEMACQRQRGQE